MKTVFKNLFQSLLLAALLLAPASLFSQTEIQDALKRHVNVLTADSLMGRRGGSEGEKKAADYISKRMQEYGLTLFFPGEGQDFSFVSTKGDTIYSRNILGIVEGSDKNLKNEYIVVGAHMDHLGFETIKYNGKDSVMIYRGADDNASGVACMLEIAKMVSERRILFKRSVIFVAFGAEESGMTGSWYFVNRAFKQKEKIHFMLNLDMVGRSSGLNRPTLYTVLPNIELSDVYNQLKTKTLVLDPLFSNRDYFPSDHQPFSQSGIPVTLITTGLHREYHSLKDTPSLLDYKQMEDICDYAFAMLQTVSDRFGMLRRTAFATDQDKSVETGIFSISEVTSRPQFLHGDERQFLKRWVYANMKYPVEAIKEGIQGRVIVEVIIEKNGEVGDVSVLESADLLLAQEAVRVVKASPKWKPAKIGTQPVRTRISIPIEFRLKR